MALNALAHVREMRTAPNGQALTPTEKLVALIIADFFNAEHGYAWPSMIRLAADSMLGERQCRRTVRSLEAKGVIVVEVGGQADGRNVANRYRFPGINGVPAPLALVQDAPSPMATVADSDEVEALTASTVADGLREVTDAFLADFPDDPVAAYLEALDAASLLAGEHSGLSRDMNKFLRNTVIAHAADRVFGERIAGASLPRLFRAATTLGPDGAAWVITSLWQCATADIAGDPTSYVIKVAQNRKAEKGRAAA